MALSRKGLSVLAEQNRKEGCETKGQCVMGRVEQEEDRETTRGSATPFLGLNFGSSICHLPWEVPASLSSSFFVSRMTMPIIFCLIGFDFN